MYRYKFIIVVSLLLSHVNLMAQLDYDSEFDHTIDTFHYGLASSIYLDSIVVSAIGSGLDIGDFVKIVREDKSFNQAFYNLRFHEHTFDHRIYFFNNKRQIIASYTGLNKQNYIDKCRSMEVIKSVPSGDYFKKGNPRYFTAQLFEKLFYTDGTICYDGSSANDKYTPSNTNIFIQHLKKLIFNPGESVDVPLIGDKLAIFSPEMSKFYDKKITYESYQDSIPCYVFKVDLKEEYIDSPDETVLKYLYTYISIENDQILARNYHLAYNSFFYNFDVEMKIELSEIKGRYVPKYISYNGDWDIVSMKKERSFFEVDFYY